MTYSRMRGRLRRRGAASVEAVIVLPIFVLLFISLFYVRDQVVARQATQSQARTCAWLYSWNNCDKSALSPECQAVVTDEAFFNDATAELSEKLGGGLVGDALKGILDPVLEAAFGRALDAQVSKEIPRPAIYGGKTQNVSGSYHLACNLKPTTAPEVARDAWSRISPL
jgi:hypothetical protein